MRDLPQRCCARGDLLVVNDAATLPASLRAQADGEAVEVRLAAALEDGTWAAALLGAGDWRQQHRGPPGAAAAAGGLGH